MKNGSSKQDAAQQRTSPARRTEDGSEDPSPLHLVALAGTPERVELEPRRVLFGRGADCDVVLPGTEASRHHAEVLRAGPVFALRDLGSTNGTFLNAVRVREAELLPAGLVRMGDWIAVARRCGAVCDHTFRAHGPGLWGGAAMAAALGLARSAAASDLPVILEGETGTGKEVVARAVHAWSGRTGPFVAVNCAALPETLAEGELFGHRRGAFTGAERANAGYFRAAHGGTLLLDEIRDLPLALQVKLLRVLEQREVTPLGQTQPVPIDVRVVAAAQEPLQKAVEQRRFRADLYARLDGLTVHLPPLRERIEDVPGLLGRFFADLGMNRPPVLTANALETLALYDWPFNVRELRFLAQRLAISLGERVEIHRRDLPERMQSARPRATSAGQAAPPRNTPPHTKESDLDRFLAELRAHGGNVSRAARAAGISRMRAYRLMNATPGIDMAALRAGNDDEPESNSETP
ncbi:MAG: sigma 54-interacting transcriptional regulator [Myxococcales bacterium]